MAMRNWKYHSRSDCRKSRFASLVFLLVVFVVAANPPQQVVLADELGDAVRQAVNRIDPSVVRIRPVGSEQNTDGGNVSTVASTGVVVSADGEIITSAFSVQGKPQAILVETQDGKRLPASIVATDFVRKLVLLKAGEGDWTPISEITDLSANDVTIGQWTVAVGRFYSGTASNVSVGITSAVNRVHGMAIQTDAKISPLNYGGPLIDLSGKPLGVLVPLSPRDQGSVDSGVEWYDSGIGFAIPIQDVFRVAERLRAGSDLKPGKLGVSLKSANAFSSEILVEAVHPAGPAAAANIQKGDQIVAINDADVARTAMLESAVARSYAGDTIRLGIKRGDQQLTLNVELVDKLPIVQPGYLGLLPVALRSPATGNEDEPELPAAKPEADGGEKPDQGGTIVDGTDVADNDDSQQAKQVPVIVLESSPAATAGLPSAAVIESINTIKVSSSGQIRQILNGSPPDTKVTVQYSQLSGGQNQPDKSTDVAATATVELSRTPTVLQPLSEAVLEAYRGESAPPEVVEGVAGIAPPARHSVSVGQEGQLIVLDPTPVDATRAAGLLVLLSAADQSEESVLRTWQAVMNSHQLAIAIPRTPDGVRLTTEDLRLVALGAAKATSELRLDPSRMLLAARRSEASMANALIYAGRSPFRAVVMLDGWISPSGDQSIDSQLGRSVLLLDQSRDRQSQSLRNQAISTMQQSGLRVFSLPPASSADQSEESAARVIADWSLLIKTL